MNKEEIVTKYQSILENSCFKILSIDTVNHKPDIFMITPKHIAKSNGILDPNVAPCGNCGQDIYNHTYDTVAFLQLLRDANKEEVTRFLQLLPLKEDKLDGVVFVETKEKYRIS
jgi:hypothetical protein